MCFFPMAVDVLDFGRAAAIAAALAAIIAHRRQHRRVMGCYVCGGGEASPVYM